MSGPDTRSIARAGRCRSGGWSHPLHDSDCPPIDDLSISGGWFMLRRERERWHDDGLAAASAGTAPNTWGEARIAAEVARPGPPDTELERHGAVGFMHVVPRSLSTNTSGCRRLSPVDTTLLRISSSRRPGSGRRTYAVCQTGVRVGRYEREGNVRTGDGHLWEDSVRGPGGPAGAARSAWSNPRSRKGKKWSFDCWGR